MKNKLTLKFACIIALTIFTISAKAQTKDFSGKWKRNDSRSIVSEGVSPNTIPQALEIKQTAKQLIITRTLKNAGVTSYQETLNLDGSKSISHPAATMTKETTLTRSPDKSSFTTMNTYYNSSGEADHTFKETWKLENEGSTLHISATWAQGAATHQLEEYFAKQ